MRAAAAGVRQHLGVVGVANRAFILEINRLFRF
jgi:hypothetical protein